MMKTLSQFKKENKREIKWFTLESGLYYKLQKPLDEVLVFLRDFRNKYDSTYDELHLDIEFVEEWTVRVTLKGKRIETLDEYNKRINAKYSQLQRHFDKQREVYERLKKIYGD